MTLTQALLIIALGAPLASFFALLLARNHPSIYRPIALGTPIITLIAVFSLIASQSHLALTPELTPVLTLLHFWDGLTISFALEPLGLIFAGLVSVLWPISVIYSLSYLKVNNLQNQARFCAFFSLTIAATLGLAFAADLMTMLICYEVLTLSTYPLVTHEKTAATKNGGRIYLGYLLGSSFLFLLPTIVWIYVDCGNLAFTPNGFMSACSSSPHWALLLLVYGAGKAALIPMHRWLPAAMIAPAPVSALLHAVAVVKSGVFVIIKCALYVFGYNFLADINIDWLVYLSGTSMVIASLIALNQDSMKKVLAYSTVSQLGFIVMGTALLKPALVGTVLHFVAHASAKITLFFAVGAIQTMTGKSNISQLRGVGYVMPWTMACFIIAALSLVGLPPLGGFASKWFLLSGAMTQPHFFAIAAIVISTMLNIIYFGRIAHRAFLPTLHTPRNEAPFGMVLAITVPVMLVIGLPLLSPYIIAMVAPLL